MCVRVSFFGRSRSGHEEGSKRPLVHRAVNPFTVMIDSIYKGPDQTINIYTHSRLAITGTAGVLNL